MCFNIQKKKILPFANLEDIMLSKTSQYRKTNPARSHLCVEIKALEAEKQ